MEPKICEACGVKFSPPYKVAAAYWRKRRFCSWRCKAVGMVGEPRSNKGKPRSGMESRFWSKVYKSGVDDCWLWTGAKNAYGYGYLAGTCGRSAVLAHRLSYEINNGGHPGKMCVCHTCDNPACVNPKHLFLGTRFDNNADRVQKGRTADHSGENNPNAKLTRDDVVEIKRLRGEGRTQQEIADQFGVSQNRISSIVRGLSWQ